MSNNKTMPGEDAGERRKSSIVGPLPPGRLIMPASSFPKGGEAVLCAYADLAILMLSFTTAIIWIVWTLPITRWMVSIEGDVFKSTFRTYSKVKNITVDKLQDGKIQEHYILVCASVDVALAVVQFFVSFAVVINGPSPKSLRGSLMINYIWLIVNVPIYLAYAIWRIVDQNWITLGIGMIVRGGFIYKVVVFTLELKKVGREKPFG